MSSTDSDVSSPGSNLRAPKAAAISGIIFSILLIISLVLFFLSLPNGLDEKSQMWLNSAGSTLLQALKLVPFTGIAFLWFMGVVHDRLKDRQDRFLVTVFTGSGLLFLTLLFISAGIVVTTVQLYITASNPQVASIFFSIGSTFAREIMNTYTIRMAGVFMISTCTLFIRTRAIPRWIAWLGYGLALLMLLRLGFIERMGWLILFFPIWILLVSVYILIDNYRVKSINPQSFH